MSASPPLLSVLLLGGGNDPRVRATAAAAAQWAEERLVGLLDSSPPPPADDSTPRYTPLEWRDDFSHARNALAEQARGRWILWLEPGETLPPPQAAQLRDWLEEEATPRTAGSLLIRRPAEPGAFSGEQVRRIRLLPNEPAIRFHGRVRERLDRSVRDSSLQVEPLPFFLQRGEEEIDPLRARSRAQRNVRLAGLELREHGRHARLLNCLGEAFHTLGDHEAAADFFRQSLLVAPAGGIDRLEAYYGLLTTLPDDPGFEPHVKAGLRALEEFPCDLQLLFAMGSFLQAQGRRPLSTRTFQTACRFGVVEPHAWHLTELALAARLGYVVALEREGRVREGIAELLGAPAGEREHPKLLRRLSELYRRAGETDAALVHLLAAVGEGADREALRSTIRGVALAENGEWTAARVYLEAAWQAGCRDPLCVKWRALARVRQGDPAGALEALAQWKLVEPDSAEAEQYLQMAAGIGPTASRGIDPAHTPGAPHEPARSARSA